VSVSVENILTNPARTDLALATTRVNRAVACFHCGEPCIQSGIDKNGKSFCCNGCLTVHDILAENGLEYFYQLNDAPGVRIRRSSRQEQWLYLDDPTLQQRLLDFTDGKQSRITFHIPAIHCIACVWLLENLFRLHPGVAGSLVNFQKREVAITFGTEKIKLSELVALLTSIGYEPTLTLDELEKQTVSPARKRQWLQVGVSGFAFGNIMLISLPLYLGMDSFSAPIFKNAFGALSLAFALPVLIYSAADYWKSAWLSVRRRVLTLDFPIALGLAALYARSAYEIISGTGVGYLDSLAGLVFFLLCGRVFQQKTQDRLIFDRDYKSFFPLSVVRKTAAGENHVSISNLSVGDKLVLRNGELIPADSKLIHGPAFIDYSFVTGESEPLIKREGDYLYAGGKQIGAAIEVEMLKPVSHSYLTSLWNHETFQKKRDDELNSLTNSYSRKFTFIVIGVALCALAFWVATGDLSRGIKAFTSVLIVACPCALALAAPFTLGTAQRLLARLKIFLKNAQVLERMARVDAIVFDKTGTLTSSGANAVNFVGSTLTKDEERLIYSLARQSTHPLSSQITESLAANGLALPVNSFHETPGCGIEGTIQGHAILIGSRTWLESRKACTRPRDESDLTNLTSPPPHVGGQVHVAIDGNHRGAFTVKSTLRTEAENLIRNLAAKYEIALLSGDNERERETFRAMFGDNANLHFNQSPMDKLGFIERLQQSGKTVMMVGDGLNDAGALKQSDVGVAVVEKVGTFSPASDVILEASQIPHLANLLTLSQRSTRIVRLSFGISALYNIVGVSIAAVGILSPVICAVLMPVSSVSVVLFAVGMTAWTMRRTFGVRWQSAATTQPSKPTELPERGAALRFTPQSKQEATS